MPTVTFVHHPDLASATPSTGTRSRNTPCERCEGPASRDEGGRSAPEAAARRDTDRPDDALGVGCSRFLAIPIALAPDRLLARTAGAKRAGPLLFAALDFRLSTPPVHGRLNRSAKVSAPGQRRTPLVFGCRSGGISLPTRAQRQTPVRYLLCPATSPPKLDQPPSSGPVGMLVWNQPWYQRERARRSWPRLRRQSINLCRRHTHSCF